MSVAVTRRRVSGDGIVVPLVGVLALAATAVATVKPTYGVGLAVAVVLLVAMVSTVMALPVFLVLTMFVESLSVGSGLTIGRAGGALALVLVLVFMLVRGVQGLRPNWLLALTLAYGVWITLSIAWAEVGSGVSTSLGKYALVVSYLLAFAVLVRSEREFTLVLATFAGGALAFGLEAVVEFVAHHSSGYRASGLQGDPNTFGVYQVIALPATLAVAAAARKRVHRRWLFATVGVIVVSVMATVSRTAILALVAVALMTLVVPARAFFSRRADKAKYVAALAVSGVVAGIVGAAALLSRLHTSGTGNRGSGRIDLWSAALSAWSHHPWVGIGAGNFEIRALDFLQSTPGVDSQAAYLANIGRVVHNTYLETLTELGVVGLAVFVGLLAATAWLLVRAARRARVARASGYERSAYAILAGLLAYVVAAFFLSIELNKPFWILAGLALALDVATRRLPAAAPAFAPTYAGAVSDVTPAPERREGREGHERDRAVVREVMDDLRRRRGELERLEAEVRERLAEAEARAEQAASREQEIVARSLELAEQAAALARSVEAVEARRSEQPAAQALEERRVDLERALQTREVALGEREQALAARLEALDATAEARERELAERETALERRVEAVVERERALAAGAAEVETARERELAELERRLEAVVERERALAAGAAEVETARERELAEREAALERRVEALTQRERALAARAAQVERAAADDTRERELADREAALERRVEALTQREQALVRRAAELGAQESRSAPAQTQTPTPTAFGAAPPLVPIGRTRLGDLDAAIARAAATDPERAEELAFYVQSLRAHADAYDVLPAQFEGLVADVFGDLL